MRAGYALLALSLALGGMPAVAAENAVVFVQAERSEIRSEPKTGAQGVGTVTRGQELQVLEEKGAWYRVSTGGKAGWISRLFVSTHRPVGQAELGREIPTSVGKASRRRAPSYAVAAAARGLGGRTASRRDGQKVDMEALEKMEKGQPSPAEIAAFAAAISHRRN